MKSKKFRSPLIKLSSNDQLPLYLIREELKIRKFFNILKKAGINDVYYEPDLSALILKSIGLDDGSDETFYLYSELMDKRSKRIKDDNDSIMKQALKVFLELNNEKKRLRSH